MIGYEMRLTLHNEDHDYMSDVKIMEKTYFSSYIRSIEGVNNELIKTHLHYYIEFKLKYKTPDRTLRDFVRKKFGLGVYEGNQLYSLTKTRGLRPIHYLSYILKEDPNPVIVGFTDSEIHDIKEYKEELEKKIKSDKSLTKYQKLVNFLKEKKGDNYKSLYESNDAYSSFKNPFHLASNELYDLVLEFHTIKGYTLNSSSYVGLIQTLLWNNNEDYKNRFQKNCVDKVTHFDM